MSEFMTCHWCGASEEWEPCHSSGRPMEPTIKSGWEGWYRCMNCTHIQGDDALLHDPNTIIYTPMGRR